MTNETVRGWFPLALGVLFLLPVLDCRAATTTITIGGSEQFALPTTWDNGLFSLSVNGHTESVTYGQFSTPQSVASGLAAKFALDCTSPVIAHANGAVITLTTKRSNETFAQISASASWNTASFTQASFSLQQSQSASGSMAPSLALSCTPNPIPSGGSANCTAELPSGATGTVSFSMDGQPAWSTADVDGKGSAPASTLSGLQPGNHTLSASYSGDSNYNATSQTLAVNVDSGALNSQVVYSYSILMPDGITSGYQPNGNIQAYNDTVNGQWSLQYDGLNRVANASLLPVNSPQQYMCWRYDSFGNRTMEMTSASSIGGGGTTDCSPTGASQNNVASYDSNNHLTGNSLGPLPAPDAAGNTSSDGTNSYLYDGEGRLCAMGTRLVSGGLAMFQYIYDADGNRVAKGIITSFSCNASSNGFTPTSSYVLDQDGHQVTEMAQSSGQNAWAHTNVYAGGVLLATYDALGLHFHLGDWLGNRRVQTNAFGQVEERCVNAPFGDGLICNSPSSAPNTADDATEHHFTGKERDAESGNDYFGARYYASSMGRFISPDPMGIPSGDLNNPQSLNLFSYVLNNPLVGVDPDGKECVWDDGSYDSNDDPDTGDPDKCAKQGGTWIGHDVFVNSPYYRGDWTDQGDADTADLVQDIQSCSATVGGGQAASLLIADAFTQGYTDDQTAYLLASAQWESNMGSSMVELGGAAYLSQYDGNKRLGNTQPGDGALFRGRGYVQITGRTAYQGWSKVLGVNLVGNPNLATNPDIAAEIASEGAFRGTFTGRSLYDYINPSGSNFQGARGVINGDGAKNGPAVAAWAYAFRNTMSGCR